MLEPIRSIFEKWTGLAFLLILLVWNPTIFGQSVTLEKIVASPTAVELQLDSAAELNITSFTLQAPLRIVIDLQGVESGPLQTIEAEGKVKRLRYSQFDASTTRVVLDLEEEISYQIEEEVQGDKRKVYIRLGSTVEKIELLATSPLPILKVSGEGKLVANSFYLPAPDRLVVDFEHAQLSSKAALPQGVGLVTRVRASQFQPHVVRVVLDLKKPMVGHLKSTLEGVEFSLRHRVERIYWQQGMLFIDSQGPMPTEPVRQGGLSWLTFPHSDGSHLRLPQVEGLTLTSQQDINFQLGIDQVGSRLRLTPRPGGLTVEFLPSALVGVTVVVDPGHGGSDPGAIGYSGSYEKSANLAIAKYLVASLEEYGATVVMTRAGDSYVSLGERVEISQSVDADIFVSIHCNSFGDSSKSGVETFYHQSSPPSMLLAQHVQSQLVSLRPCNNRGVKVGNLFVLRENPAVAILTEVAFISNPEEEALLIQADYQKKVGKAIADGIEAFLETQ